MTHGRDTRTALIDAAEELFARHGLEGVSMRQITAFAGQRNESAIHYHFGKRRDLIQAVVDRRWETVDRLRRAHLARLEADGREADLRGLCGCVAYPQLDLIRETGGGRYYIRFLDQVLRSRSLEGLDAVWRRSGDAMLRCIGLMRRALADLPDDVFVARVTIAIGAILSGMAAIEGTMGDALAAGRAYDPEPETENLLDMAAASLAAPMSEATRAARNAAAERGTPHFHLPQEWLGLARV